LYSQNRIGKLDYKIDIGLHNASDEHAVQSFDGIVYMTDRDWISLKFKKHDLTQIGVWKCIDGFSDYNSTPRYDLTDYYPNNADLVQDCNIFGNATENISNDRINLTVEFGKMFNTGDSAQDIKLVPSEYVAF